jgi:hypothetical protein
LSRFDPIRSLLPAATMIADFISLPPLPISGAGKCIVVMVQTSRPTPNLCVHLVYEPQTWSRLCAAGLRHLARVLIRRTGTTRMAYNGSDDFTDPGRPAKANRVFLVGKGSSRVSHRPQTHVSHDGSLLVHSVGMCGRVDVVLTPTDGIHSRIETQDSHPTGGMFLNIP